MTAPVIAPGGLAAPPPLTLYVHIPWCVRKCPYCDFNSHQVRDQIDEQAYADALIADLEQALPSVWGRRVHSIFFGGGTPSLFAPETIDTLLSAIRARLPLTYEVEITLEANPGTVDAGKFAGFRAAGVNRLSLGIQSFDDRFLKALGRIHGGADAQRAAALALEVFERVNLDLMYALPGQTMQDALADVRQACLLGPQHLSCYHLTLEPNTAFYHDPPPLPDDDASAAMQEAIEALVASHGYQHYETSAFSRAGGRCRHNLNYWLFGDYLGIGAGAHSKLSFQDRIVRQARFKHPARYMAQVQSGSAIEQEHALTFRDLPLEFMMNALRLTEGFDMALFELRTGLPAGKISQRVALAEARGLLQRNGPVLQPTRLGQRFLNELLQLFMD